MTREAQETFAKPARTIKDAWARGMTDRYGNTRVAKIMAAYNDLRAAIRAGDIEAAERALDRYEPWADYVFGAPKVKPLVWDDFEGRGAKASGWRKANYLITKWSDGRFDLVESYPGYSGENISEPRYDTLEAAKAAAQADYERRILSALEGYND